MDQPPADTLPRSSLIRPFLGRTFDARAFDTTTSDETDTKVGVRAYLMTGGRTGAGTVKLEFEAMLSLSERGRTALSSLAFERRKIAEICVDTPQSVAEIAAKLHLPLGVAQVIAGDMVGDALLNPHKSNTHLSDDVAMLKRLIQGVRAL